MSDLKPKGRVVIIKDNEMVVNKWDYYLLYTIALLTLAGAVLRVLAWWLS